MTDIAPNPRGFFDRATKGLKTEPVQFEVEAGRISFLAETLGETNPVHHDRAAARAAGYPDVVAPPTFAMVVDLETGRAQERRGEPSVLSRIGCDFRRLLHGEERYDYHGLIFAGDTLSIMTEVVGFEDKKGGTLELAHLRSEIRHPERGVVVTITRSLVHRLA
ncbi:MAG: MaoC family dehydratase N-terminal domain-containing protein [Gemmobacter sp.]